jgi:hypothetical protein
VLFSASWLNPDGSQLEWAFTAACWVLALALGSVAGVASGRVISSPEWHRALRRSSWAWVAALAVLTVGWFAYIARFPQETPDGELTVAAILSGLVYISAWSVGLPVAMAVGLRLAGQRRDAGALSNQGIEPTATR